MSNRMPQILILLAALILTGCVGNPSRPAEVVRHDLGDPGQPWGFTGFPIAAVSVSAAGWLDSTAQTYRLDYADDLQRHAYARSRWVATAPADHPQWAPGGPLRDLGRAALTGAECSFYDRLQPPRRLKKVRISNICSYNE